VQQIYKKGEEKFTGRAGSFIFQRQGNINVPRDLQQDPEKELHFPLEKISQFTGKYWDIEAICRKVAWKMVYFESR
jgi:hypothetical protein